ncbi:hypothetical protein ACRAWF_38535 [Streptomyces sp. L7]
MPTWGSDGASGDWGGSTVAFMKGSRHLYESVKFNTWLNTDPAALALENQLGGLYPAANAGLQLPALSREFRTTTTRRSSTSSPTRPRRSTPVSPGARPRRR